MLHHLTFSFLIAITASAAPSSDFERWLKVAAVAGAAIAFLVGVAQYVITSRSDFKKRFCEERIELYRQASSAAASVANADSIADAKESRTKFWNLYWGELSIIEDNEVRDAMVTFGEELHKAERGTHHLSLKKLSYNLARACRHSLKNTWEPVRLDDIEEHTSFDHLK